MVCERYEYLIDALKEAEGDDEVRFEKQIEELDELVKRTKKDHSTGTYDQGLLLDIKKQLTEIYLFIEKIRKQENRRAEWELHPPSSILEGFKEYMKNSETNPFEESGSKTV